MMKIEKASRDDWEKLGADLKIMYDASVRVSCRVCKMFGKSHPISKTCMRVYKILSHLKSDLDDEAYNYAKDYFKYEALSKLFYGDYVGSQKSYTMKVLNM